MTGADLLEAARSAVAANRAEPTATQASAVKRGRNPRWPYVPVLVYPPPPSGGRTTTTQIRGKAFATRAEAVAYAQRYLDQGAAATVRRLCEPRERALREAYGLPREIGQ